MKVLKSLLFVFFIMNVSYVCGMEEFCETCKDSLTQDESRSDKSCIEYENKLLFKNLNEIIDWCVYLSSKIDRVEKSYARLLSKKVAELKENLAANKERLTLLIQLNCYDDRIIFAENELARAQIVKMEQKARERCLLMILLNKSIQRKEEAKVLFLISFIKVRKEDKNAKDDWGKYLYDTNIVIEASIVVASYRLAIVLEPIKNHLLDFQRWATTF